MPQQRDSYELLCKFDKLGHFGWPLLLLLQMLCQEQYCIAPRGCLYERAEAPSHAHMVMESSPVSAMPRENRVSETKVIRLLQAVMGMPSATDSLPVVNGMLLTANKIAIPALRKEVLQKLHQKKLM